MNAYLAFVRDRHHIWELRQAGAPQPWTADPILASHKFTNVFRVLDAGSQFLLGMLQEDLSPRELLMRAFLYRHTGRPEPWEFFEVMHDRHPLVKDLPTVRETWRGYRGVTNDPSPGQKTLSADGTGRRSFVNPVFTGAYLVFPQSQTPGTDKLDSILDLTARLFSPESPDDIVPTFLAARSQAERFAVLRRNKGVGDFMSMQILTDWGYATEDRENEFVVAGPGAVRGAKNLAPGRNPVDTIRMARDTLDLIDPPLLAGRPPSLMDIQNTMCEWSKYVRYREKPTPAKPYLPAHPGPQPEPNLPLNWSTP